MNISKMHRKSQSVCEKLFEGKRSETRCKQATVFILSSISYIDRWDEFQTFVYPSDTRIAIRYRSIEYAMILFHAHFHDVTWKIDNDKDQSWKEYSSKEDLEFLVYTSMYLNARLWLYCENSLLLQAPLLFEDEVDTKGPYSWRKHAWMNSKCRELSQFTKSWMVRRGALVVLLSLCINFWAFERSKSKSNEWSIVIYILNRVFKGSSIVR